MRETDTGRSHANGPWGNLAWRGILEPAVLASLLTGALYFVGSAYTRGEHNGLGIPGQIPLDRMTYIETGFNFGASHVIVFTLLFLPLSLFRRCRRLAVNLILLIGVTFYVILQATLLNLPSALPEQDVVFAMTYLAVLGGLVWITMHGERLQDVFPRLGPGPMALWVLLGAAVVLSAASNAGSLFAQTGLSSGNHQQVRIHFEDGYPLPDGEYLLLHHREGVLYVTNLTLAPGSLYEVHVVPEGAIKMWTVGNWLLPPFHGQPT